MLGNVMTTTLDIGLEDAVDVTEVGARVASAVGSACHDSLGEPCPRSIALRLSVSQVRCELASGYLPRFAP